MEKCFIVDENVFEVMPEYCVGLVSVKGIKNDSVIKEIEELLDRNVKAFAEQYQGQNVREIKNIQAFREAFYKLEMNPNKYMCSIEALAKRAQKAGALPHINPVVDLGNALSIKYVLPMGAHDIDRCESDLKVRFSETGDTFLPLGEEKQEEPAEGELVYASSNVVKTRRWIWRQSEDGKITSESENLVFPIDGFMNVSGQDVIAARDELAELLKTFWNCEVKMGLIDRNCNRFRL